MTVPTTPDTSLEPDWFDFDSTVFDHVLDEPGWSSLLNERQAQRAWLAGFGSVWAEYADDPDLDACLPPDPRQGTSGDGLPSVLQDRTVLLRQRLTDHKRHRSGYDHEPPPVRRGGGAHRTRRSKVRRQEQTGWFQMRN